MLVQICCSVDSHYFLQKLKEDFNEKIIGYFYNPNIHPYSEYKLRFIDVERSCNKIGITLIDGEYNLNGWFEDVVGLEDEPEKAERCLICFIHRLRETAKIAYKLGEKKITTTLLMSPKKSLQQLKEAGERVSKEYDLEFVFVDYKKNGGTNLQFSVAKAEKLYHQDYCGCMFALSKQREYQKRFEVELISPINRAVLPNSIEEKINLYEKVSELRNFEIVKNRFLNYRLLSGKVLLNSKVINSYIVSYSNLKNGYTKSKVEFIKDGVGYLNKDGIKFIDLAKINSILSLNLMSVRDLYFKKFDFDKEIREFFGNGYDLSPILIVDNIVKDGLYEIFINSFVYEDVRENLLTF